MKMIRLRQPRYMNLHLEEIKGIESAVGDEKKKGTLIYFHDKRPPFYCDEAAKKVRERMEEEKSKEEIFLDAVAISLLLKAANESTDGRLHFTASAAGLNVTVGAMRTHQLQGSERSEYEHAEKQIVYYELMTEESKGIYRLNKRGYEIAKHFVACNHPDDLPFSSSVKLPARFPEPQNQIGLQINQWNNNTGDVNNAVSEKGNAEQSIR